MTDPQDSNQRPEADPQGSGPQAPGTDSPGWTPPGNTPRSDGPGADPTGQPTAGRPGTEPAGPERPSAEPAGSAQADAEPAGTAQAGAGQASGAPDGGVRYGLDDEPGRPPTAEQVRYGLDDEPGEPPAQPGYPGGEGYPGANGYPGADGYPGAQGYPGAGGYPGGEGYPGAGGTGYPGYPPGGAGFTVPGRERDPLTGTPDGGFEGWAGRTVAICRRSMGPVLAVLALTSLVPTLATLLVTVVLTPRLNSVSNMDVSPGAQPDLSRLYGTLFGVLTVVLVVTAVVSYLTSVGWVAALRLMATDAAGRPRDIGAALRFGARRGLALWGWYLLAGVTVMVGVCACFVPAIYLALALSMIAPIAVFEPTEPAFTRSFRLVHSHFWPTVGRLVVLALVVGGYEMLVSCVVGLITGANEFSTTQTSTPGLVPSIIDGLLQSILFLPAAAVGIAGILAAYAELRARQAPTTTETLADSAA